MSERPKLVNTANEILREGNETTKWVKEQENECNNFCNKIDEKIDQIEDNLLASKNHLKKAKLPMVRLVLASCAMIILIGTESGLITSIIVGIHTMPLAMTALFILLAIVVLAAVIAIGIWIFNTFHFAEQNLNKSKTVLVEGKAVVTEAEKLLGKAKNLAKITEQEVVKINGLINNVNLELEKATKA